MTTEKEVSKYIYIHYITPYAKINEIHPMILVEEIKNIWNIDKKLKKINNGPC